MVTTIAPHNTAPLRSRPNDIEQENTGGQLNSCAFTRLTHGALRLAICCFSKYEKHYFTNNSITALFRDRSLGTDKLSQLKKHRSDHNNHFTPRRFIANQASWHAS
jgi:hypothetical protein